MQDKSQYMSSSEIREKFLSFFKDRGHAVVPSSSVVPHGDSTLMFTNSGMVQFKDVFLGVDTRPYKRAVSVQACIRAGGKHNDLDNVGHTARHHTFFEMLGNWSFGDYFKQQAIEWSWELLTQVYKLDPEKLWATVYKEDQEAYDIWTKGIGLPAERVVRIGDNKGARYASDNFWMMAEVGPCGPCSEIFYDHGPEVLGGPPGSPDENGDRFIEIWNNVFMQFNMDAQGKLTPLPAPCVDTGMGLERLAAILQGVHSNYHTDTFKELIKAAGREVGSDDLEDDALKVISDHLRSCAFIIAGGVVPSNEGRGFVLRRIARRAVRHGYKLGARVPFMHRMVPDLVALMGEAYPELTSEELKISAEIQAEEARFFETVGLGMKLFEEALSSSGSKLDGQSAFKLHDTYGFPLDLTRDLCRERGVEVDVEGFNDAMGRQKEMGRLSSKFAASQALEWSGASTDFFGHSELKGGAKVLGIFVDGIPATKSCTGQEVVVVVDRTPFYAQGGGQSGDKGSIVSNGGVARVVNAHKIKANVWGHRVIMDRGDISVGEEVVLSVDPENRHRASCNHSAAHVLHWALEQVLGAHVRQMGQSVDASHARFDFTHGAPMTPGQIEQVERLVNDAIRDNRATSVEEMTLEEAKGSGAKSLVGETYGQSVRVVSIGESKELCGGTHVERSGNLGLFRIKAESGVASGVRRIEALTGRAAMDWTLEREAALREAAKAIKADPLKMASAVAELDAKAKGLERAVTSLSQEAATQEALSWEASFEPCGNGMALVADLGVKDPKTLRAAVDALLARANCAGVALGCAFEGKAFIAVGVRGLKGVAADAVAKIAASALGGSGGGKNSFAMAGGADTTRIEKALGEAMDSFRQMSLAAKTDSKTDSKRPQAPG